MFAIISELKGKILLGIAILVILGAAYGYWSYSQNKIASLIAKNAVMSSVVEAQNVTINGLQKNFTDLQIGLDTLNTNYSDISAKSFDIRNQFALGVIGKKDIKAIELKYNKAFNSIIDNLNKQTQTKSFKKVN